MHIEPLPAYFMHVPKTGGMTLAHWLRGCYGRHYIDLGLPQLGHFVAAELKPFRCYHPFHHGRSLFDLIGRSDLFTFTMLREPVERAVSEFYHQRRLASERPQKFDVDYLREIRPVLQGTIEDCIRRNLFTRHLSNLQTQTLGKRADYTVFLKGGELSQRSFVEPFAPDWLIDPNDLALISANAHAWLDEMAVVGLSERYDESALMIADMLGLPVLAATARVNVNPQRSGPAMRYRDQLAPDAAAHLEEMNRCDQELYAHATELFERQWARFQARPRRTYSMAPRLRIALKRAKSGLKRRLSHIRHEASQSKGNR